MFTLYERFIQQIKQEQIRKYNEKHREYLIRTGKIKQENKKARINNNTDRVQKRQERKQQENVSQMRRPITNTTTHINGSYEKKEYEQRKDLNFKKDNQREQMKNQQRNKPSQVIEYPLQQKQQEKWNKNTVKQNVQTQREKPKQPEKKIENIQNPFSNNNLQVEEVQSVELVQCPQGCGRKFNSKALEKHIKICQKGQVKRKVFKVKVVDEQAEKLKKDDLLENEKKNKVPKWKKDSNQIRNALKAMQSQGSQQATETQKPQEPQQEDDRKLCPGCGRKFNQKAAEKHIPGCVQRNNMKPNKK